MKILPDGDPSTWSFDNIEALIDNIVSLAGVIAGGLAVIYLIVGAIGYFTAFGNEEKANKAKTTITWAIIGIVVIFLSKIIISEILGLVT